MLHNFRLTKKRQKSATVEPTARTVTKSSGYLVDSDGHGTQHIDLTEINRIIVRFSKIHTTSIRELIISKDRDYTKLINYVSLLHGTESYSLFVSCITKAFQGINDIHVGTIGGYLYGCFTQDAKTSDEPGCSVTCAGSVPRPDNDGVFTPCKRKVILAVPVPSKNKEKGEFTGYSFHKLCEGDDQDFAYLYIHDCSSIHRFPGFNHDEKKKLAHMGVDKVAVYGFDNGKSIRMQTRLSDLNRLKSRVVQKYDDNEKKQALCKQQKYITIIVIVIILILLIAALVISRRNSSYK